MRSHRELIDALGGSAKLADFLGLERNAVGNWRKRGIPWRHRHDVARLAITAGVALPEDFLSERAA